MLMTGKQVKEMAAREGWPLVKYLPFENLDGRGKNSFEYKYGVNVPLEPVNLSVNETCTSGGLYFTYIGTVNPWTNTYGYYVTVPDEAQVVYYPSGFKFKTDKLIIERPWNVKDYEKHFKLYGPWFRHVDQTPEKCIDAVRWSGILLLYVKEQTPEICLAAVQRSGYALEFVKEKTPELCLAAVNQAGYAIRFVDEQTPELCLAAVQTNGYALLHVAKQTPEICLAAVCENGGAIQWVRDQTPEICAAAVQEDGRALAYVEKQTPEICLAAVQQDGMALEYVEKQTPGICLAAVQQDGMALEYAKKPTAELRAIASQNIYFDPYNIR